MVNSCLKMFTFSASICIVTCAFIMSFSCLKVILDILDKLFKPDVNALLHEFGFQVRWYLSY